MTDEPETRDGDTHFKGGLLKCCGASDFSDHGLEDSTHGVCLTGRGTDPEGAVTTPPVDIPDALSDHAAVHFDGPPHRPSPFNAH